MSHLPCNKFTISMLMEERNTRKVLKSLENERNIYTNGVEQDYNLTLVLHTAMCKLSNLSSGNHVNKLVLEV